MSSAKRSGTEQDNVEAKRQRTEEAKQMMEDLCNKMISFAEKAKPIDVKIIREQTVINKKFWPELKAIFKARDALIEKEEKLWGSMICSHPHVTEEYLVSPIEVPFLCDHLKSVELEDYLDNNGSYEITFTFGEGAAELVEPLVWKKRVILKDDCETVDEEKTTVTALNFKTDGMNPIRAVAEMKKSAVEQLGGAVEALEDLPVYSLATWFSETKPAIAGEFGEIFRKAVYPHPETVLAQMLGESEDSDDNDDDEDDEADESAGEGAAPGEEAAAH